MPRELKNATITHVSYVDKGANQKKFFLTKSEEQPNFTLDVKVVTKADDEQKLVYGVVYEPDVVDAHGDYMTAAEIEKAAHTFISEYRNIDKQHDFETVAGEVVESYIAPQDFTVGDQTITKGTWVLVTKASDELWESIQKGEFTGYSMAGTAEVIEKDDKEMKKFFSMLKSFFTKGEVKDKFYDGKQRREFWDALYIFEDVFYDEMWNSDGIDVERVGNAAKDFAELLAEIASNPTVLKEVGAPDKAKLQKSKQEEEIDVNKEELQALLKEAMAPIAERLEALEKADEGAEGGEAGAEGAESTPVEKSAEEKQAEMVETLKAVMKEALDPINERLDKVEKARSMSKSADQDVPQGEGQVTDVWKGFIF